MMEERKKDHIDLAFNSILQPETNDRRFFYEPMLSGHPVKGTWELEFLGKKLKYPMWISSMTGGTFMAGVINRNLAKACNEFGFGMGLGSCRVILDNDDHIRDFDLRQIIGDHLPFFANLGIAQVEALLAENLGIKIAELVNRLQADGLIVHVNPLQEWLQPEGDRFNHPPIDTIKRLLDQARYPIIVKEVGQGIGPESLRALLQLPLAAIEFAGYGGTNFSKAEILRTGTDNDNFYEPFAHVGHTAAEMLNFVNRIIAEPAMKQTRQTHNLIISGGIQSALDGYHLMSNSKMNAVFGQASAFLKHAMSDYESLQRYTKSQVDSLTMAKAFLRNRE